MHDSIVAPKVRPPSHIHWSPHLSEYLRIESGAQVIRTATRRFRYHFESLRILRNFELDVNISQRHRPFARHANVDSEYLYEHPLARRQTSLWPNWKDGAHGFGPICGAVSQQNIGLWLGCWRCHDQVRLIQRPQWYLRISAYLEENDRRLDELEHLGRALARHPALRAGTRSRASRSTSQGAGGAPLTVFTPHRDALGEARFVADLAPPPGRRAVGRRRPAPGELDELRSGGWERSARDAETIPLIDTASFAVGRPGRAAGLSSRRSSTRASGTFALGIPGRRRTTR